MNNVFYIDQSCEYLLGRAAKHRRAGRYDEAMALLTRAHGQYGPDERIEMEFASVYEEMECDNEAIRAYLRVVRAHGKEQAKALFHLTLLSSEHEDNSRALSYFNRFTAANHDAVPIDAVAGLYERLFTPNGDGQPQSRKAHARDLEHRAIERLRAGKHYAAECTLRHAMALDPDPEGYALLACCALMREDGRKALEYARWAHRLAPARVQMLCVLSDALLATGEQEQARNALYLAAVRAKAPDDLGSVALACAKRGEDEMTLRLTGELLQIEPFDTQGMRLRACALLNAGQVKEASRLFGRLCGLLPEDTVCEYYYRLTREGNRPRERVALGNEVPAGEVITRTLRIVHALYAKPGDIARDAQEERAVCRLCAWAFRSAQAGPHAAIAALMLMSEVNTAASREVMLDAMTDPQIGDPFKQQVLQTISSMQGPLPYDIDIGGKLLSVTVRDDQRELRVEESAPVRRACIALAGEFTGMSRVLLNLWNAYVKRYGPARGRWEDACAAALECAYRERRGVPFDAAEVARKHRASPRLCRLCLRRMHKLQGQEKE